MSKDSPFLEHLDEENIGEVANTSSSGKWLLWRWVDHGAITSQEWLWVCFLLEYAFHKPHALPAVWLAVPLHG